MNNAITIVLPVYNESEGISFLLENIEKVVTHSILFILVDDGSSDSSLQAIRSYTTRPGNSKRIVKLSRNFGHQKAIMAGLSTIKDQSTIVVVMDADFQDSPTDIPTLYDQVKSGYDCAYATRLPQSGSITVNFLTKLFYIIQEKMVSFKIPRHAGVFSAFNSKVLNELLRFYEVEPYFPGLRAYVGFNQIAVPVERSKRRYGTSRVGFIGLINLSLNGLMGFSPALMRAVLYLGITVTAVCFMLGSITVVLRILGIIKVLGFTTLAVFILGLFGIQMTITGFIGEYLGKLFIESKRRPAWIIQESEDA